ncbi:hypothetical protein LCGC14_0914210 [marine sediment metagenome]|uniref:Uncharacterized protein n=1 Tax=marine sediment metagenome TaxID=412755 RepID=A0A0F9RZD8_9ZZZZ
MDTYEPEVSITEKILTATTFVWQQAISKHSGLASPVKMQVFDSLEDYDAVGVRFRVMVCGEDLEPIVITVLEDWWQAFKLRWFPQFLLKRYPVRTVTHTWDVKQMYPDIPVIEGGEVSRKYTVFNKVSPPGHW